MKIYVELLEEGTQVWRPVEAVALNADSYQIVGENSNPEDERWAFGAGSRVRCRMTRVTGGEEILVAYEEVPN